MKYGHLTGESGDVSKNMKDDLVHLLQWFGHLLCCLNNPLFILLFSSNTSLKKTPFINSSVKEKFIGSVKKIEYW